MSNDQNNDLTEQKTLSQAIRNRIIESIESHGNHNKKDKRKSVFAAILSKIPLHFKLAGLGVIVIAVFLLCGVGLPTLLDNDETQYVTSGSLVRAVEIEEIATVKGQYRGIAEHEREIGPFNWVNYYIKYNAEYTATFDMSAIDFEFDENNKKIYAVLPEPTIETDIKDIDSLEYLPEDAKAQIKDVLTICKEDAANGINQDFIKERAREGLKETVEFLTKPLIGDEYSLDFK